MANFLYTALSPQYRNDPALTLTLTLNLTLNLTLTLRRDCHLYEVFENDDAAARYRTMIEKQRPEAISGRNQPLLLVYSIDEKLPLVVTGPFTGERLNKVMAYHKYGRLAGLHRHNLASLCFKDAILGGNPPVCVGVIRGLLETGQSDQSTSAAIKKLKSMSSSSDASLEHVTFTSVDKEDFHLPFWGEDKAEIPTGRLFAIRKEDYSVALLDLPLQSQKGVTVEFTVKKFVKDAATDHSKLDWVSHPDLETSMHTFEASSTSQQYLNNS